MQKVISKRQIENKLSNNDSVILNEGYWEDFKYYTGKLTKRYKADGKIFGKSKVDAEAKARIQAILDKASNEVIRNLDNFIKQTNPEFPNNRKGDDFLATVLHIANIYESLVNATKIPEGQKGYLPADAANEIIRDLREYVKKALDTDLYAVYSGLDEDLEMDLDEETEMLNELDADEIRANLKSRRVAQPGDEKDFESTRIDTLLSDRLVAVLAGSGVGLAAFGWLAQSNWLKDILEYLFNKNEVTYKNVYKQIVNKLNFTVESGDGFTQTVNKTLGLKLGPNTTTDQFLSLMKQKGFGSTPEEIVRNYGIDSLSPNSRFVGDAALALKQKGKLLKDVFEGIMHGKAGTLMAVRPGPFIAKQLISRLVKQAVVTTTTTGTAIATGLAAAAPILAGIGVALIGAGALVKLFRMKGQRQSRAATLNDLYQMLREVGSTKNNQLLLPAPSKPEDQKQIGGRPEPRQLGQGEEQPEVTVTGGERKKPKFDSSKLDAQDTEFEPVEPETTPEGEPEVRQLGAGARRLGQGETKPETTPERTRQLGAGAASSSSTIKNGLVDFFKDVLKLKPRQRRRNIQEAKFTQLNSFKDETNRVDIENFSRSVEFLSTLAVEINKAMRNTNKLNDDKLVSLLTVVYNNPVHREIVNIKTLVRDNINNRDLLMRFVKTYLDTIKVTPFRNINNYNDLQSEKESLDEVTLRGEKSIMKYLENFKINFKKYLTSLFRVFEYLAKEPQQQPVATEEQPLQEAKKKKNKYSKKASEFIGKEISHLEKDKGYPHERAVAAAINVAKEKGMKVGAKKKKSKKQKD